MSNEMQAKFSGNDEFFTRKTKNKMHLDERAKKWDALQEQKSGILGQVGDGVGEGREMPKVSEYNKEEEMMNRFDPSLSLEDQSTNINALLKEEKKGYSALFLICFRNVRLSYG